MISDRVSKHDPTRAKKRVALNRSTRRAMVFRVSGDRSSMRVLPIATSLIPSRPRIVPPLNAFVVQWAIGAGFLAEKIIDTLCPLHDRAEAIADVPHDQRTEHERNDLDQVNDRVD